MSREVRHGDLVNEMAEKRGLRGDLHIQERRCGLRGDRCNRLQPMDSARGKHIDRGDGEQDSPVKCRKPSGDPSEGIHATASQNMIGLVDGFE
jgi:hypothetical protein